MSYHTEPKMRFQETRGIVTVLLARAARGRDRPDPQPSGGGIHRPVPRLPLASRLAGVGRSAAGPPARALAVVLLVACAALLAAPRPAQAQTVCSSAADWCATMTVGYTSTVTGSTTVEHFGYELDTSFGALDDDDFAYLGTDYTVAGIIQFKETASGDVTSNAISLLTNPSLPDGTVLTVNRTELTVGPGSHSSDVGQEVWDLLDLGITLGLVQDQMVLVSLELPPPPQHPGSLQGGPQIVFAANAGASEPTARCLSAPYELRRWANRPGGITATWSLDVVEPSGGFRNGASFTASDFDISNGQVKTIAGVNYPHQEASADVQPFEMVITAAVGFRAKSRTVQVHILKSDRTDHAWHNVCGQTPGEPPRRPRMRVADTEAHEAPGAKLDFVVTLNRAAPVTMTADYWTYAGTATDGADYLHRYGTLTFAVGESEKTVRVPIIDDSVEDDGETVHFALHNPTGGAAIADDEAVGIIRNSESPPTATFGEAAASHDGSTAFVVPVEFSEAVTLTAASPSVSGGTVLVGRRGEVLLQLHHVARERLDVAVEVAPEGMARAAVGARRAAQPEIDASGKQRGQGAELLRDHQRRVVGQHDPAGPDADRRRGGGHVADDHRGRGARDARHVVVLGQPDAPVAPALGVPCEVCRVAERHGGVAAFRYGRQIEDRARGHAEWFKSVAVFYLQSVQM